MDRGFKTKAARLGDPAQAALAASDGRRCMPRVLGFEHPATGEALRFESRRPEILRGSAQSITTAGNADVFHATETAIWNNFIWRNE